MQELGSNVRKMSIHMQQALAEKQKSIRLDTFLFSSGL